MSGALRAVAASSLALAAFASVGCGPEAVKIDRTGGLAVEFLWSNATEQQSAYYTVACDGAFGSAGGLKARARETAFAAPLSDADVARFVELVRATSFATRPDDAGSGEPSSDVTVRASGKKHRFVVLGADPSVDALRGWLAEVSLRQFRDVLEAQPQAGPRRR